MVYRAGAMGAKDWPTVPPEFAGSLAALIETRLHAILSAENGSAPFPLDDNSPDARARRAFFVAVAQAVLEHLSAEAPSSIRTGAAGSPVHAHEITVRTT